MRRSVESWKSSAIAIALVSDGVDLPFIHRVTVGREVLSQCVQTEQPYKVVLEPAGTYMSFRQRFLEERDLMDAVPGRDASSIEGEGARLVEFYVCQHWASIILVAAEGQA